MITGQFGALAAHAAAMDLDAIQNRYNASLRDVNKRLLEHQLSVAEEGLRVLLKNGYDTITVKQLQGQIEFLMNQRNLPGLTEELALQQRVTFVQQQNFQVQALRTQVDMKRIEYMNTIARLKAEIYALSMPDIPVNTVAKASFTAHLIPGSAAAKAAAKAARAAEAAKASGKAVSSSSLSPASPSPVAPTAAPVMPVSASNNNNSNNNAAKPKADTKSKADTKADADAKADIDVKTNAEAKAKADAAKAEAEAWRARAAEQAKADKAAAEEKAKADKAAADEKAKADRIAAEEAAVARRQQREAANIEKERVQLEKKAAERAAAEAAGARAAAAKSSAFGALREESDSEPEPEDAAGKEAAPVVFGELDIVAKAKAAAAAQGKRVPELELRALERKEKAARAKAAEEEEAAKKAAELAKKREKQERAELKRKEEAEAAAAKAVKEAEAAAAKAQADAEVRERAEHEKAENARLAQEAAKKNEEERAAKAKADAAQFAAKQAEAAAAKAAAAAAPKGSTADAEEEDAPSDPAEWTAAQAEAWARHTDAVQLRSLVQLANDSELMASASKVSQRVERLLATASKLRDAEAAAVDVGVPGFLTPEDVTPLATLPKTVSPLPTGADTGALALAVRNPLLSATQALVASNYVTALAPKLRYSVQRQAVLERVMTLSASKVTDGSNSDVVAVARSYPSSDPIFMPLIDTGRGAVASDRYLLLPEGVANATRDKAGLCAVPYVLDPSHEVALLAVAPLTAAQLAAVGPSNSANVDGMLKNLSNSDYPADAAAQRDLAAKWWGGSLADVAARIAKDGKGLDQSFVRGLARQLSLPAKKTFCPLTHVLLSGADEARKLALLSAAGFLRSVADNGAPTARTFTDLVDASRGLGGSGSYSNNIFSLAALAGQPAALAYLVATAPDLAHKHVMSLSMAMLALVQLPFRAVHSASVTGEKENNVGRAQWTVAPLFATHHKHPKPNALFLNGTPMLPRFDGLLATVADFKPAALPADFKAHNGIARPWVNATLGYTQLGEPVQVAETIRALHARSRFAAPKAGVKLTPHQSVADRRAAVYNYLTGAGSLDDVVTALAPGAQSADDGVVAHSPAVCDSDECLHCAVNRQVQAQVDDDDLSLPVQLLSMGFVHAARVALDMDPAYGVHNTVVKFGKRAKSMVFQDIMPATSFEVTSESQLTFVQFSDDDDDEGKDQDSDLEDGAAAAAAVPALAGSYNINIRSMVRVVNMALDADTLPLAVDSNKPEVCVLRKNRTLITKAVTKDQLKTFVKPQLPVAGVPIPAGATYELPSVPLFYITGNEQFDDGTTRARPAPLSSKQLDAALTALAATARCEAPTPSASFFHTPAHLLFSRALAPYHVQLSMRVACAVDPAIFPPSAVAQLLPAWVDSLPLSTPIMTSPELGTATPRDGAGTEQRYLSALPVQKPTCNEVTADTKVPPLKAYPQRYRALFMEGASLPSTFMSRKGLFVFHTTLTHVLRVAFANDDKLSLEIALTAGAALLPAVVGPNGMPLAASINVPDMKRLYRAFSTSSAGDEMTLEDAQAEAARMLVSLGLFEDELFAMKAVYRAVKAGSEQIENTMSDRLSSAAGEAQKFAAAVPIAIPGMEATGADYGLTLLPYAARYAKSLEAFQVCLAYAAGVPTLMRDMHAPIVATSIVQTIQTTVSAYLSLLSPAAESSLTRECADSQRPQLPLAHLAVTTILPHEAVAPIVASASDESQMSTCFNNATLIDSFHGLLPFTSFAQRVDSAEKELPQHWRAGRLQASRRLYSSLLENGNEIDVTASCFCGHTIITYLAAMRRLNNRNGMVSDRIYTYLLDNLLVDMDVHVTAPVVVPQSWDLASVPWWWNRLGNASLALPLDGCKIDAPEAAGLNAPGVGATLPQWFMQFTDAPVRDVLAALSTCPASCAAVMMTTMASNPIAQNDAFFAVSAAAHFPNMLWVEHVRTARQARPDNLVALPSVDFVPLPDAKRAKTAIEAAIAEISGGGSNEESKSSASASSLDKPPVQPAAATTSAATAGSAGAKTAAKGGKTKGKKGKQDDDNEDYLKDF